MQRNSQTDLNWLNHVVAKWNIVHDDLEDVTNNDDRASSPAAASDVRSGLGPGQWVQPDHHRARWRDNRQPDQRCGHRRDLPPECRRGHHRQLIPRLWELPRLLQLGGEQPAISLLIKSSWFDKPAAAALFSLFSFQDYGEEQPEDVITGSGNGDFDYNFEDYPFEYGDTGGGEQNPDDLDNLPGILFV